MWSASGESVEPWLKWELSETMKGLSSQYCTARDVNSVSSVSQTTMTIFIRSTVVIERGCSQMGSSWSRCPTPTLWWQGLRGSVSPSVYSPFGFFYYPQVSIFHLGFSIFYFQIEILLEATGSHETLLISSVMQWVLHWRLINLDWLKGCLARQLTGRK